MLETAYTTIASTFQSDHIRCFHVSWILQGREPLVPTFERRETTRRPFISDGVCSLGPGGDGIICANVGHCHKAATASISNGHVRRIFPTGMSYGDSFSYAFPVTISSAHCRFSKRTIFPRAVKPRIPGGDGFIFYRCWRPSYTGRSFNPPEGQHSLCQSSQVISREDISLFAFGRELRQAATVSILRRGLFIRSVQLGIALADSLTAAQTGGRQSTDYDHPSS